MSRKRNPPRAKPGQETPSPASDRDSWSGLDWLACGAVAALAVLVYANSLGDKLTLDSVTLIEQDWRVQSLTWTGITQIFRQNYWWPSWESDLYRPLTTLSFLTNYSILGNRTDAFGYHFVNIVLHAANAALVFRLFQTVLGGRAVPLAAAAVFAVHPLTTEAVANVAGRADLLVTFFVLMALELHRRSRDDGGGIWTKLGLLVCALGASFSKETGVVLIALLPALDFATAGRRRESSEPAAWWSKSLFVDGGIVLIGIGVYLTSRYLVLRDTPVYGQIGSDNPIVGAGFWPAEMTALKVLGYYWRLIFWPAQLSCDYSYRQVTLFDGGFSGQDLDAWIGLALVSLLVGGLIYGLLRNRPLFFFLAFFFVTILPVANLLFPIGTVMGERLMYLPLVGCLGALATLAVPVVAAIGRRWPVPAGRPQMMVAGAIGVVLIVPLAVRTVIRNLDWRDNVAIWGAAVRSCPDSFKVYKGLATGIRQQDPRGDRIDETIAIAEKGLQIIDRYPLPLLDTPSQLLVDLTTYYMTKGDRVPKSKDSKQLPDEAIRYYKRAVATIQRAVEADRAVNQASRDAALAKGREPASIVDVGAPSIHRTLAAAELRLRNFDAALEACRSMRRLAPLDWDTYRTSAIVYAQAGKTEAAIRDYMRALFLGDNNPDDWQAVAGLLTTLEPQPPPVVIQGGRYSINEQNPASRRLLNESFYELARYAVECNRPKDAREVANQAVATFKVPPEPFGELWSRAR